MTIYFFTVEAKGSFMIPFPREQKKEPTLDELIEKTHEKYEEWVKESFQARNRRKLESLQKCDVQSKKYETLCLF